VTTSIDRQIAQELGVREQQVTAAVALLDGGATVPFIARYRKEVTGALDDAQLRTLDERLRYLRELEERRAVILNSIREQGKLDDALEAAIRAADSRGGSKTSICRSSRSAAPRPKSRRRPGWSRSPICCWRSRNLTRWSRRRASSMPKSRSPMRPARSTAPVRSWWSALPRTPT
jgi:hypothetical protein